MKVLQLYYKMPFPMNDGGAYAIYHSSLAILSQGIDLKVLAMDLLNSKNGAAEIPSDFIKQTGFECVVVDNRLKPWRAFTNLFANDSYFVERFYSEAYSAALKKIMQQTRFDVIQLEHAYLGVYLDVIRSNSNAKIVLRSQNVENQLWYNYLRNVKNPFTKLYISIATKRLEAFEKRVITGVDAIMALTGEDALYFKKQAPQKNISSIAIGFDLEKFSNGDTTKQYHNYPVLFHLGSMDWKPNILGLRWFIRSVWPLLKNNYPGIQLEIAGKNMPAWFFKRADARLKVQGRVEDALRFQEDKTILIVPMLAGSGIRIKILEAMALGKTVISTTIGAKGIAYENGKHLLIADTPQEFVEQVGRCIASPELCKSIGKNAQLLVFENYELKTISEKTFSFYKALS